VTSRVNHHVPQAATHAPQVQHATRNPSQQHASENPQSGHGQYKTHFIRIGSRVDRPVTSSLPRGLTSRRDADASAKAGASGAGGSLLGAIDDDGEGEAGTGAAGGSAGGGSTGGGSAGGGSAGGGSTGGGTSGRDDSGRSSRRGGTRSGQDANGDRSSSGRAVTTKSAARAIAVSARLPVPVDRTVDEVWAHEALKGGGEAALEARYVGRLFELRDAVVAGMPRRGLAKRLLADSLVMRRVTEGRALNDGGLRWVAELLREFPKPVLPSAGLPAEAARLLEMLHRAIPMLVLGNTQRVLTPGRLVREKAVLTALLRRME
jgi:hypothetical protein